MITRVLGTLREVLDLLTDEVTGCPVDPLPCRVAVYPGQEVPWDSCEVNAAGDNGQLWASLNPTFSIVNEGSCQTITFQAEIGIVRCVATVTDDGQPPSVSEVEMDAAQQGLDADAIYQALMCCAGRSDDIRSMILSAWRPVGPSGGCAGGIWTVRGVLNVCC